MGSDHDQSGPAESEFAVRLAVIKDIAQTMRDPQSPGDIMQAAVDSLHVHFFKSSGGILNRVPGRSDLR
jgi:hypothetical protein